MLNTNTNAFRAKVNAYICASIYDFEGTEKKCAQYLRDRFEREYNYEENKKRIKSHQLRVAEWLSGLPINIAYTWPSVKDLATEWHECKISDAKADQIYDRWFRFMAAKLMQMWARNGCEPVR